MVFSLGLVPGIDNTALPVPEAFTDLAGRFVQWLPLVCTGAAVDGHID
jgi:hypothetical protein